jgi:hypothetical protein
MENGFAASQKSFSPQGTSYSLMTKKQAVNLITGKAKNI